MRIIHLVAAGLAALVLTACSTARRTETDIVVVKTRTAHPYCGG